MKTTINLIKTVMVMLMLWIACPAQMMAADNSVFGVDEVQAGYVVVNGVNVRLRFGPGTNYAYLTWDDGSARHPSKGERLTYLGETNNWYKVRYAGYDLYISKDFSYFEGTRTTTMVKITGTGVRLRFGPGLNYGYLTWNDGSTRSPKKGEKLTYLGSSGDWYKVLYAGSEFYVFKQYAQLVY